MEADRIAPADERRHVPAGGRDWEESWYLDFVAFDGRLAGYVRLTLRPHERTAWFWAGMVGGGPPLVTVRDHEVPMPSGGAGGPGVGAVDRAGVRDPARPLERGYEPQKWPLAASTTLLHLPT